MKTRRTFLSTTASFTAYGLLLGKLSSCKTSAQRKIVLAEGVPYNMKYLSKNVGFFTERGGTIGWLANKEGIVIVDTQFPDQSTNVKQEVSNLSDGKIKAVINTHHHGDHTSGNVIFDGVADQIIAHTNSKKNQFSSAQKRGTAENQIYPTTVFDKQYKLTVGDETIRMDYYGAAHTDGDIVTYFEKANVIHMGDLVFNRRFPYIDKSAGAHIGNWVSVLDKVNTSYPDDVTIIFGHSDNGHDVIGNKEDIKAFKNYLERLLVFGQEAIKAGKTLEEVKAQTTSILGAPQWQGKGIERSLDAVYAELAS